MQRPKTCLQGPPGTDISRLKLFNHRLTHGQVVYAERGQAQDVCLARPSVEGWRDGIQDRCALGRTFLTVSATWAERQAGLRPETAKSGFVGYIVYYDAASRNYTRGYIARHAQRRRPAKSAATLTIAWSKVSGPGTVTFGNANTLNTTTSFFAAGTYILRLTASNPVLDPRASHFGRNQPVRHASADVTVTFV